MIIGKGSTLILIILNDIFLDLLQELMLLDFTSMTSIVDQNAQWASYAKPGGWNGNISVLHCQIDRK